MTRTPGGEVKALLESAWADIACPARGDVAYDSSGCHLECNAVAAFFAGKAWNRITLGDLQNGYDGDESACLCFMSAAAFAYYLPTYMLLALDHYAAADLASDAPVAALTPVADPLLADFQAERFSAFSTEQRAAIVAFLEWIVQEHGSDWGIYDPREALAYWRDAG